MSASRRRARSTATPAARSVLIFRSLSSGRHGKAARLPRVHPTRQRAHVGEPSSPIPRRLTGSARLVRSGTVEDQLLVRRQRGRPALQLRQRDRAFEPHPGALRGVGVGTDQQRLSRLHELPRVLGNDSLNVCHWLILASGAVVPPWRLPCRAPCASWPADGRACASASRRPPPW